MLRTLVAIAQVAASRVAVALLATSAPVATLADTPLPPVRVILVGDSTMASSSGYGNALCARLRPEVTCLNLARGGRSSKTYRAEGLWAKVMDLLSDKRDFAATYVLIQFGHNDQPGKPERSTTLPEFEQNMTGYARDVREAGGTPVLVTPLTRREFRDGKVVQGLEPWAEIIRKVAKQNRTALLDLHRDSVDAVQKMGPTRSNELAPAPPPPEVAAAALTGTTIAAPKPPPVNPAAAGAAPPASTTRAPAFDYTHLGPHGAEVFSAIVSQEIRHSLPKLKRYVLPEPRSGS